MAPVILVQLCEATGRGWYFFGAAEAEGFVIVALSFTSAPTG